MRLIIFVVFLIAAVNLTFAKMPPGFKSLAEAVAFISACLDANDSSKLQSASLGGKLSGFEALKYAHEQTALTKLYSGKEFPNHNQSFKLGGHGQELGHVHIDFVKRKDDWFIDRVWVCR